MNREEKRELIEKLLKFPTNALKYNEEKGCYSLEIGFGSSKPYFTFIFYDYENLDVVRIAKWFSSSIKIETSSIISIERNKPIIVSYGDKNLYSRVRKYLKSKGVESWVNNKMFVIAFSQETYQIPLECINDMGFTKTLVLFAEVFDLKNIKGEL